MEQEDGGMVVNTASFRVHIPPGRAEPYRAEVGKDVIFGIRPEDIHDRQFPPPDIIPAEMEATVDVLEQMGNEMIVHLQTPAHTFIARTDPRTNAFVGNKMGLMLNLENMHLFDAQTELSLAYEHKQDELKKPGRAPASELGLNLGVEG